MGGQLTTFAGNNSQGDISLPILAKFSPGIRPADPDHSVSTRYGHAMIEYDIGSKLRKLRLARNLTLRSVAREVGFSIALLSQIEKNNISPPIPTLSKLANFFGIRLSSLFAEKDERQRFEIIRKDERKIVSEGVSVYGTVRSHSYELLTTRMRNRKMTPVIKRLPEGPDDGRSFSREGESFLYVLEGNLNMLINNQKVVLGEGDSIYFDTSIEHKLFSREGKESVILEVCATP